jgi:hypothetical protein
MPLQKRTDFFFIISVGKEGKKEGRKETDCNVSSYPSVVTCCPLAQGKKGTMTGSSPLELHS